MFLQLFILVLPHLSLWKVKPATAWGCACSIKCLFKDISSALTISLPLLSTVPFRNGCFGNYKTDTNVLDQLEISSPLHTFTYCWGWKADYGLLHRVPYSMGFFEYSLWTHLLFRPPLLPDLVELWVSVGILNAKINKNKIGIFRSVLF
jgi:hypothetical protein